MLTADKLEVRIPTPNAWEDACPAIHPRKGWGSLKFNKGASSGEEKEVYAKAGKVYELINKKAR